MSEGEGLLDSKTLSNLLGELLDSELSKRLLSAIADGRTDNEILEELLKILDSEEGE